MSLASRLEELRNKKLRSKEENKKELYKEVQKEKSLSRQLKEKQKQDDLGEDSPESTAPNDKKTPHTRSNNLSYTLKECEDWESKQNDKLESTSRSSTHNYSKLAEQVYNKEVSKLEVDRDEYQKHIRSHTKALKPKTAEVDGFIIQKPSKEKVNALAKGIQETSKRRADQQRRKQEAAGGSASYINEKNRQFNMKLDRDYK